MAKTLRQFLSDSIRDFTKGVGGFEIVVARSGQYRRPSGMGAKYLPTIKDLKASQRFQQKQRPFHKFKKSSAEQSAKKGKK